MDKMDRTYYLKQFDAIDVWQKPTFRYGEFCLG